MLQVDRLYEAVAEKSPVCVGLDTDFSYIPAECVDKTLSKGENIFRFNRDIIEATRSVAGLLQGADRLLRGAGPGRHAGL